MPTLQDQDIGDLVKGTLKELGRMKFQQIAQTLQDYEVMGRILREDRMDEQDGIAIQKNLMTSITGSARMVGLHEPDVVNIGDTLATIEVPWRHMTHNYAYERREMLVNRGESRIVDLLKVRRSDCMLAITEKLESQWWSKPADSADKLNMFGVPYWVVANATTGFNGGDPTGFTGGAGGLTVATTSKWKNWTALTAELAGSTPFTKDGLIALMREAYIDINFKSPIPTTDYSKGGSNPADRYRLYTNKSVYLRFSKVGEDQNENLGRDLASMDGVLTFHRNPIICARQLDGTTAPTNPIYMLCFDVFQFVVLKGDYLRETEPEKAPNQHNTWIVHVDFTGNPVCVDRRRQAVIVSAV